MKVLWLISLILLFVMKLQANGVAPHSQVIKYEPISNEQSLDSVLLPHGEELLLRAKLAKINVWPVSDMQSQLKIIPGIEQLYTSTDNQKAVLAKFGLKLSSSAQENVLISMGDYFLYHTTMVNGGSPLALAFVGFSNIEAQQAVMVLRKSFLSQFLIRLKDQLNKRSQLLKLMAWSPRSACAQSSFPVCSIDDDLGRIQTLNAQTFATTVGQHMLRCLAQAGGGVAQSAKGVWASIRQAATNPKAFWDSKVKEFVEIKNFLANMGSEIRSFWSTLQSMDPSLIPDIACTLAGQIAGDVVSKIVVGGGLALVAIKFISLLNKLRGGAKILEMLSKLKAAGQLKDASGAIGALLNDKMPTQMTNLLEKFSKTNPLAVRRVLQCF